MSYTTLTWTPKMWHKRAQRRHAKFTVCSPKSSTPTDQKPEPLALDHVRHKKHFPNAAAGKSNGLRAYFGYD